MPSACASPSIKCCSGIWQVAQDIVPVLLSCGSENSCFPSVAAAGLFAAVLDALNGGGRRSRLNDEIICRSFSVNAGSEQAVIRLIPKTAIAGKRVLTDIFITLISLQDLLCYRAFIQMK